MFWEKKLGSWVDSIRDQTALPLRVELWNGQQVDFGRHALKVTIRVPKVSVSEPVRTGAGARCTRRTAELSGDQAGGLS